MIKEKTISINNQNINVLDIYFENMSVTLLPSQGFSLISYKIYGHELLSQWKLEEFIGSEDDILHISKYMTDTFRKGFGPGIGPWFGGRSEDDTAWYHGLTRFSNWSDSIELGDNWVKGHLTGSKKELLGKKLDDICGFHMEVIITYMLDENGLSYKIENKSEGNKGTYGIHWYFRNPPETKVKVNAYEHRLLFDGKTEPLDQKIFSIQDGAVCAEMNFNTHYYVENKYEGNEKPTAVLEYPDKSRIEFFFSDSFYLSVINAREGFLCIEPVSGLPFKIGEFTEGVIRILPRGGNGNE